MAMYMSKYVVSGPGNVVRVVKNLEIHVGLKINFTDEYFLEGEFVLQADGDELEYCRHLLSLPKMAKRVFKFTGESARTILLNWGA